MKSEICLYCHKPLETENERYSTTVYPFCNANCDAKFYRLRLQIIQTFEKPQVIDELYKLRILGMDYIVGGIGEIPFENAYCSDCKSLPSKESIVTGHTTCPKCLEKQREWRNKHNEKITS